MKKISIFVLAVLLLAPMSIKATENNETEETMEALFNDVTGTWVAINNGLTDTKVNVLAIDPKNTSVLYAGTDAGVFKSSNAGGSWNGTPLGTIIGLVISPSNPSTLYAMTADTNFGSDDGGGSWETLAYNGLVCQYGHCVAVDPSNSDIVYSGGNCALQKSTNGGGFWDYPILYCGTYFLVIDSKNPSILYAGTDCDLQKSTDGGANWSKLKSGLNNAHVTSLAIDPSKTSIIYAGTRSDGVFKSTDAGASWTAINSGLTNSTINALAIDPANTNIVYAGTDGGAFESADGGATWSAINSGLTNTHVTSLAIDPLNPDIIYTGTDGGGVFKSSIAGGPPTLHVSKSGTGDGTVTSAPSGIDCGSTCTGSYTQGTSVTLTASPSSGSVFAGWSGACSGTGNCVVTMDNDKSVTATFNSVGGYSLTVLKTGTGDGTVTSSPAGISCGSACSESFQKVTKMKLTAKANTDSIFTGWSGEGYTGIKPCQVTVDSAISITANFDKKVPHISVSLTSLDFGSVKVSKSLKKTLKIMNNGTGDLTVSIGGVAGTDFNAAGSTNVTVKPNRSYSLGITFKPSSTGSKAVTLVLSSNDPDAVTISITLTGTGM